MGLFDSVAGTFFNTATSAYNTVVKPVVSTATQAVQTVTRPVVQESYSPGPTQQVAVQPKPPIVTSVANQYTQPAQQALAQSSGSPVITTQQVTPQGQTVYVSSRASPIQPEPVIISRPVQVQAPSIVDVTGALIPGAGLALAARTISGDPQVIQNAAMDLAGLRQQTIQNQQASLQAKNDALLARNDALTQTSLNQRAALEQQVLGFEQKKQRLQERITEFESRGPATSIEEYNTRLNEYNLLTSDISALNLEGERINADAVAANRNLIREQIGILNTRDQLRAEGADLNVQAANIGTTGLAGLTTGFDLRVNKPISDALLTGIGKPFGMSKEDVALGLQLNRQVSEGMVTFGGPSIQNIGAAYGAGMVQDTLMKPGEALFWTGVGIATGGVTRALGPGVQGLTAAARAPGASAATRALGAGVRIAPIAMGGLFAGSVGLDVASQGTPGKMVSRLGGLTATEILPMIGGAMIGAKLPIGSPYDLNPALAEAQVKQLPTSQQKPARATYKLFEEIYGVESRLTGEPVLSKVTTVKTAGPKVKSILSKETHSIFGRTTEIGQMPEEWIIERGYTGDIDVFHKAPSELAQKVVKSAPDIFEIDPKISSLVKSKETGIHAVDIHSFPSEYPIGKSGIESVSRDVVDSVIKAGPKSKSDLLLGDLTQEKLYIQTQRKLASIFGESPKPGELFKFGPPEHRLKDVYDVLRYSSYLSEELRVTGGPSAKPKIQKIKTYTSEIQDYFGDPKVYNQYIHGKEFGPAIQKMQFGKPPIKVATPQGYKPQIQTPPKGYGSLASTISPSVMAGISAYLGSPSGGSVNSFIGTPSIGRTPPVSSKVASPSLIPSTPQSPSQSIKSYVSLTPETSAFISPLSSVIGSISPTITSPTRPTKLPSIDLYPTDPFDYPSVSLIPTKILTVTPSIITTPTTTPSIIKTPSISLITEIPSISIPPTETPMISIPPYIPPTILIPNLPMGMGGGGGVLPNMGYGGYLFEESWLAGGNEDPFGVGKMNFDVGTLSGLSTGANGRKRRRR